MRYLLATLAVAATCAVTAPAQAQNYPWCAEYGGSHGGRNCGFSTIEQCRAAISGDNTATCIRNYSSPERRRNR